MITALVASIIVFVRMAVVFVMPLSVLPMVSHCIDYLTN